MDQNLTKEFLENLEPGHELIFSDVGFGGKSKVVDNPKRFEKQKSLPKVKYSEWKAYMLGAPQ